MGGGGTGQAGQGVDFAPGFNAADPTVRRGHNTYKLPHLGKDKAARSGAPIPRRLEISEESWTKGNAALAAAEGQGLAA